MRVVEREGIRSRATFASDPTTVSPKRISTNRSYRRWSESEAAAAAGKGKKGATIKNRPEKKEARGSVVRAVGAPFDKHDRAKFVLTDFNLPIDLCTGQKLTVLCLRVGTGACRRWWMLSSDAGRVGTAGAFEAVPPNALYQFAFNIIENLRTSRRRLCV